ncbi:hypothetical protein Cgig2_029854 [Carnegiea gigantea]|uniref:Uncharacterized protein n=1 Tax=Carnegiea gigantea TaxID=171969 RepID=A0A9Q1K567_9CARY|nr:hypothetical protein Cgig2_029854 [Carnegiea gigantea]
MLSWVVGGGDGVYHLELRRLERCAMGSLIGAIMLCYLDKVVFGGVTPERWFPIAISWTKAKVQKRVDNEEKMGGMFGRGAIHMTFDYYKVVQAVEADLQQYFQDLKCERMQKDNARVSSKEHVNWVIHKHGQLHLSKAINKLITIPVEGSSVSIGWGPSTLEALVNVEAAAIEQFQKKKDCSAPSFSLGLTQEIGHFDDVVHVAAHYHEPESCDRIQVDHPSHAKGKIVGTILRLLHPIYCARILMHPINKLRMTVSETAKKFFQQEQQSRKAT